MERIYAILTEALGKPIYIAIYPEETATTVSVWIIVLGVRQQALLRDPSWQIGGADLVWRHGVYYLHITQTCKAPAVPEDGLDCGALGIDLGIVNLATDSEGQQFSGAQVHLVRTRYHLRRQRLQQCGTRNAKRRIRRTDQREARFQKDVIYPMSKLRACSSPGMTKRPRLA